MTICTSTPNIHPTKNQSNEPKLPALLRVLAWAQAELKKHVDVPMFNPASVLSEGEPKPRPVDM